LQKASNGVDEYTLFLLPFPYAMLPLLNVVRSLARLRRAQGDNSRGASLTASKLSAKVIVYVEEIYCSRDTMMRRALALLFLAISVPMIAQAQSASDHPFVVEYYYKTKWGHADEFLQLFKKNHYPLLKKEVEMGRMLKVWMDQPRYHTTEDGRWDYRVTIVFKNAAVANETIDEEPIKKQLWPDQETYLREEQRRFEILDAHWDLPIKAVDLEAKP
jgi:hypothetical protein